MLKRLKLSGRFKEIFYVNRAEDTLDVPLPYTDEELAADALRQMEAGLERPASEPPDLTLLLDVEAERQLNILRQPAPSKRESAYFRPFGS